MIWNSVKRVLKAIGFLFFSFAAGISLYISIQLSRNPYPDAYGPTTAWAVTLVIVLIGILLVVRPAKSGWPIRAAATTLFILIFAFYHQYIVAFPGRIAETVFAANLKTGMTRDEAERLARITFAEDRGVIPSDSIKYPDPNAIFVYYADWVTVCVGGGNLYVVHFDGSRRVKSWNVYPWADGC